jgi:hypothetical protein
MFDIVLTFVFKPMFRFYRRSHGCDCASPPGEVLELRVPFFLFPCGLAPAANAATPLPLAPLRRLLFCSNAKPVANAGGCRSVRAGPWLSCALANLVTVPAQRSQPVSGIDLAPTRPSGYAEGLARRYTHIWESTSVGQRRSSPIRARLTISRMIPAASLSSRHA